MPIKGQSKTTKKNLSTLPQKQFLLGKDVEPGEYSLFDHDISKKLFNFFVMDINYIEKMMERFNSGELKKIFRNISRIVIVGLTESGRAAWQELGEKKKMSVLF